MSSIAWNCSLLECLKRSFNPVLNGPHGCLSLFVRRGFGNETTRKRPLFLQGAQPLMFSSCFFFFLCVCVVDAKVYPPLVCGGWYLVTPPGSQLTCPAKCSSRGYERGSRTGLTTKTPRPRPRLDIQLYTPNRSRSDL